MNQLDRQKWESPCRNFDPPTVCKMDTKFVAPCLSATMRCAPVASPDDNFAENASRVPNCTTPAIQWKVFYSGHKENLSPMIFKKDSGPHSNSAFSVRS